MLIIMLNPGVLWPTLCKLEFISLQGQFFICLSVPKYTLFSIPVYDVTVKIETDMMSLTLSGSSK